MAFKKENKVKTNFTKITIGLASPEEILANSYGEVLKTETETPNIDDVTDAINEKLREK